MASAYAVDPNVTRKGQATALWLVIRERYRIPRNITELESGKMKGKVRPAGPSRWDMKGSRLPGE